MESLVICHSQRQPFLPPVRLFGARKRSSTAVLHPWPVRLSITSSNQRLLNLSLPIMGPEAASLPIHLNEIRALAELEGSQR